MSAEERGPLTPGTKLEKYEVLRYLASGGMAEIYLARSRGLAGFEKVVVLKRILPKIAEDPDVVGMFLDEARLAATLHHPNLVQVYDIGKDKGSYFFTMEYIHGEDLHTSAQRAAKKKRGFSLQNALFVATQVAAGLHHAHDKKGADGQPLGTVHRDVSPSNIMITYDGAVKIVDFGVAKAVARQTKTKSGAIKGKVTYMSPEQARGDDIDRRSDVFALGILLFELTTGTRLFKKDHDYAVLSRLLTQDAPLPSSRREDYPPELEKIVLKALSRDPDERYETAQELQLALEEFAGENKLALSSVPLGKFMRDVVGEKPDPTEVALSGDADPPSRPVRAATGEKPAPETLSGSASRPAIPMKSGSRGVWIALGLIAVGAVGAYAYSQSGSVEPAAAPTNAAIPSEDTAPTQLPETTSAPAAPSETAPSPNASVAAPELSAKAMPRVAPKTPVTVPRPRPPVVDKPKDEATPPKWDPGSALPPVVEGK